LSDNTLVGYVADVAHVSASLLCHSPMRCMKLRLSLKLKPNFEICNGYKHFIAQLFRSSSNSMYTVLLVAGFKVETAARVTLNDMQRTVGGWPMLRDQWSIRRQVKLGKNAWISYFIGHIGHPVW